MNRVFRTSSSIRTALRLLALAGAAHAAAACAVADGLKSDDDVEVDCSAPSSLRGGMLAGGAAVGTEDFVAVFASAESVSPRDIYQLELWRNIAPFTGTVVPGTYIIEGAQTEYESCGVCLLIYGDADDGGIAQQHYIAESGVVTVNFVDNFTITGNITDVSMVSYDNGPRGACQTTVGATAFNAVIQAQ